MPRRRNAVDPDEWRVLNRLVFERDGWRCVQCGQIRPLQAHHVLPRSQGGPDHPDNLVSLCAPCHATMDGGGWKQHAEEAFRRYVERLGSTGAAIATAWECWRRERRALIARVGADSLAAGDRPAFPKPERRARRRRPRA